MGNELVRGTRGNVCIVSKPLALQLKGQELLVFLLFLFVCVRSNVVSLGGTDIAVVISCEEEQGGERERETFQIMVSCRL